MLVGLALSGCRLVTAPEERDAIASYIWHKRGQDTGDLLRTYCLGGSVRERRWMKDAIDAHAAPTKVIIACPD